MNPYLLHAFNLSATATGALVSAIWEGALLAILVFLVLRTLPRLSAAARSVIWLNVFMLLTLLHVLPMFTAGSSVARAAGIHVLRLDPRWSLAVAGVWLAVSLVRVGQLLFGAVHLRRMARHAVAVPISPELEPLLTHNGRPVELCASEDVARPSVLGFFRPRILVPPTLLEELSQSELKQVILHEMEHLHRGDDWINLLQKLALVLFPLNPALAWVERRLCAERELACDDQVLHSGSGRKAYALCLTHLAEFALVRRGFSLVLGAWERRPELVRRVHRILSEPMHSMGRRPALVAMGSLTTGALACTLVLAHAPELVRFAPVAHPPQTQSVATLADAQELGRELGGTPQFVKAVAPQPKQTHTLRHAVQRRAAIRKQAPDVRLANLRTPPPPAPSAASGTLLVMTAQWTDIAIPRQVVIAVRQAEQAQSTLVVRTAYAVVQTPNGWLVIQI